MDLLDCIDQKIMNLKRGIGIDLCYNMHLPVLANLSN